MDYDKAVKLTSPPFALMEKFYSDYFKPHIKKDVPADFMSFLFNQAWTAWRLKVSKNDIKEVLFVEWICNKLANNQNTRAEFISLSSYILSESYNTTSRLKESEKAYYNSKQKENIPEKFSAAIRLYKVFYESGLRLWGTIPYYFAVKIINIDSKATTPKTYVNISASEKYHSLKRIKTVLPQGSIKKLVIGFDNRIRNAGEGHDYYEISDKDTLLLHMIDPRSGKPKKIQKLELTYPELETAIDLCRKGMWILRNGFILFLVNNPSFRQEMQLKRPLKLREIQGELASIANQRWFNLTKFSVSGTKKDVEIILKQESKTVGKSSELLFGSGERYEIVNVETTVSYLEQIMGIIQYLLAMWGENNIPNVKLRVYDKGGGVITDAKYEADELVKLIKGEKKNFPIPATGKQLRGKYTMINEIRVPYGTKKTAQLILERKGYSVI